MLQRDYILRMIEMMGDLMRRVGELLDELEQRKLLDGACRRHCGIPLKAVEALSAESLKELLAPTPRLFASELLYARATAFPKPLEDEEALLLKSLRLLVSLWEEGELCELRAARALEMKERLMPLLLPDDLMQCAVFFSRAGEYADMEDALFQAAELARGAERQAAAALGASLLREAAKAGEAALALARTSGHELREAARELEETAAET